MEIAATCVLPGTNRGRLLSTQQPISFWGCVDPLTGNISDRRHELFGESISEKVLVFPFGKGSSTGSADDFRAFYKIVSYRPHIDSFFQKVNDALSIRAVVI